MNTPQRDLRSAGSPWQNTPTAARGSRRRPSRGSYDVAIIGAGVSGALAAAALIGLGKSVVILDRRGVAEGSTAASTAMIQWEIDLSMGRLARRIGETKASCAYRSSLDGVLGLRRTVFSHHIDCGWIDRTALTVSGNAMGQRALAAELELRHKLGLPSAWMPGSDLKAIYGIDRTAALLSGFNAELNPVKLTRGLIRCALKDGMELVAPADVTAIAPGLGGLRIELAGGGLLTAGKVIVCAGYEALPAIPRSRYRLMSTWAIATPPLAASRLDAMLPGRPLIWEQSDPYLYLRTTDDGRIIAGGEDAAFIDPSRRDRLIAAKADAIVRKLKRFLPGFAGGIAFAWAGTFDDSPTGLPSIGPVPGMPGVFTTLGAGGNGITFSAVAAAMSREWVLRRRHPDLGLYGFA